MTHFSLEPVDHVFATRHDACLTLCDYFLLATAKITPNILYVFSSLCKMALSIIEDLESGKEFERIKQNFTPTPPDPDALGMSTSAG